MAEHVAPRLEDGALVFFDESFTLPERNGAMALYRFSHLAEQVDITDLEEKSAIYDMLEASIAPADWDRFQRCAMKHRSTEDELLEVIGLVMVELSGRPTSRPSASSDGPPTAVPSSTSTPAERAIAQLGGRPDLANVIDMGQKARAS